MIIEVEPMEAPKFFTTRATDVKPAKTLCKAHVRLPDGHITEALFNGDMGPKLQQGKNVKVDLEIRSPFLRDPEAQKAAQKLADGRHPSPTGYVRHKRAQGPIHPTKGAQP